MRLKPLLAGMASYLPGLARAVRGPTGGTDSARYSYSVWLRHLVSLHHHGLRGFPGAVAELGPGDSLGVGLAALISGAESYLALDVVEHAARPTNLLVFDELCELFARREAVPGEVELPGVHPRLPSYRFPSHVLPEPHLERALRPGRLRRLRAALEADAGQDASIRYLAPFRVEESAGDGSRDLIISQAVLQYVDDLAATYRSLHDWLRPGGVMSHQVDFGSHRTAATWDGHWAIPGPLFRLMRGRRPYWLNREPHSRHLELLRAAGFEVVADLTVGEPPTARGRLARRFRMLSAEDRGTRCAFFIARRPTLRVGPVLGAEPAPRAPAAADPPGVGA